MSNATRDILSRYSGVHGESWCAFCAEPSEVDSIELPNELPDTGFVCDGCGETVPTWLYENDEKVEVF